MNIKEPENLDKSVEAALKRLDEVKKPECTGCEKGISMCHHNPCNGTLKEIEYLINNGYAKNLMLDYWTGHGDREISIRFNPFKDDIFYLKPALKGYEGKRSPFFPQGTCNLLTEDEKCSIHHIKPVQGRIACCKIENKNPDYDERYDILRTWDTDEGKELIKKWKKLVNYDDNDDDDSDHFLL